MRHHDARLQHVALSLCLALGACSSDEDAKESASSAGKSSNAAGMHDGSGSGGTSAGSGSGNAGTGGTSGTGARAGNGGQGGASGKGGVSGGSTTGGSGSTDPLPASAWVNATGNLAGLESECGNLTLLSAEPGSGRILAGVAKRGLFATEDNGARWDSLGTGSGSAVITNRPSAIVYDPEDPSVFWESGIYNGGGVYKTTDAGETFTQLGEISHNDNVSVDFSDPERKTLLVGGHEQKQTLYLSANGGESFDAIGANLPAGSHFSTEPLVLDAQTFLVGSCGYGDGECGVYRSENAGQAWERVSDIPVAGHALRASDGSIYWTTIYDSGMARSTDGGVTFAKVADNLVTTAPSELPDGRVLALRGNHAVVTSDGASSWAEVGDALPFKASGVVYSPEKKKLFAWHWDCGNVVLEDAIMSADFDADAD